jgi:hypothetical protein
MSTNENRVLSRRGARELTSEELESVGAAAGGAHTNVCSSVTATSTGDGDACLDHDVY